jgi:hypothetical protein
VCKTIYDLFILHIEHYKCFMFHLQNIFKTLNVKLNNYQNIYLTLHSIFEQLIRLQVIKSKYN